MVAMQAKHKLHHAKVTVVLVPCCPMHIISPSEDK